MRASSRAAMSILRIQCYTFFVHADSRSAPFVFRGLTEGSWPRKRRRQRRRPPLKKPRRKRSSLSPATAFILKGARRTQHGACVRLILPPRESGTCRRQSRIVKRAFARYGPAFDLRGLPDADGLPRRWSDQLNPLMIVGTTLDNSTAVDVKADRQTTARPRQMRLSLTAGGSGKTLKGFSIIGSVMQRKLLTGRAIG